MLKKNQGVGPIRKVVLVKDDQEGLGISITVRNPSLFNFRAFLKHVVCKYIRLAGEGFHSSCGIARKLSHQCGIMEAVKIRKQTLEGF